MLKPAKLPISAFVSDYDHNAYEKVQLEATHLQMYKTVRKEKPDIPYIIITRPDYWTNPKDNDRRTAVIRKTYDYAVAHGDKNVYFIDGKTLFGGEFYSNCTKDSCHPNDLGACRMASVIGSVVAKAMGIKADILHDYKRYCKR